MTTVTQGVQTRTFVYDSLSRLKQATNPESGLMQYAYDNNSNLTSKTDARSIITTYAYDNINRVKTRTYSDSTPAVSYFYDNLTNAKGRLIKVASTVSTTEYTSFDILGRVKAHRQTTDGTAYTTGYTYRLDGSLDEETYPSTRVVKNVLDNAGNLSMVQSKKTANHGLFNYADSFSYNAAGAVTSMQLGNGKWESTTFNSRLQPTQIALGTVQNGTDKLKLNYTYGSTNNNGNVLSQTITVPGMSLPFVQNYSYDELNRLASATETNNGAGTWNQVFGFDRYGNRNITAGVGVTSLMFNASNNRITTGGYSYDLVGNTIADPSGKTFTYDAENKQTMVSNGSVGQYFYDGDGKRVKKIVPSTGETTIFVYDAAGKMVAEYSTVVASSTDAKVGYVTNDHLGSPRINTDQNGNITSRHDYRPFGEEILTSQRTTALNYAADLVRKQFTGYERDNESELDFAQNRYYQSKHGRFTSTDPLLTSGRLEDPQSWNRYTYVLNNPLKYIDPLGLYEWDASYGGSATDDELKKRKGGQKIIDLRNNFRNALADAAKSATDKTLTSDQQAEIMRGVNAYGKEGEANGVTLAYGKVEDGAAAETRYTTDASGKVMAFSTDANGKVTAHITVTFGKGKTITGDTVAHEGSHTADRQDLGRAFERALQGSDVNLHPSNLAENITKYASELRAYRVSSYINQATNTPSQVWNQGWKAVDRDKAINSLLKSNKLYKLTPEKPGIQIYTEKPK